MNLDEMRDHIATQALPSVITKYPSANEIGAAELAYSYADAMLLVRDIDPAEYGTEETQGYGNSTIATKYVYERIYEILDGNWTDDYAHKLSRFLDELAHNYKVDTGKRIGEEV
jgi:hypothetical protein